ncbi:PRC-barrel domain-containing protein [Rubrimonas cliftonensis]|uniref:PRC-barrel domain-containing protein n=1 Tax=Rubrimonas cliftonensis TaxID=89524 RepID=A0A1H4CGJ3_9RHOB|nr:PRC-barrel domain-containing protein [Rubrimonas cliftonensis]SEA59531.1 PRC-barrel domain-containing protein [Rubrimonas cliftonensis]
MKRLLITTALVGLIGGAGAAQTQGGYVTAVSSGEMMASELIGARVEAADFEGDAATYAESADAVWSDIGEINDLIVSRDGEVRGVLVDVGGFLGIGEKPVGLEMSALNFLMRDEGEDFRIVVDRSRQMLEDAPEFGDDAARVGTMNSAMNRDAGRETAGHAMSDGWMTVEKAGLTAEELEGVRVHGANDDDIGEISDIVLTDGGEVRSVVLDVGGFLGMGEHRVEMPFEEVDILRESDGDDYRARVNASLERLKTMPNYEG